MTTERHEGNSPLSAGAMPTRQRDGKNILLTFLNRDARTLLRLGDTLSPQHQATLLTRALRSAVLLSRDFAICPPGFFLEDDLSHSITSMQRPLIDHGLMAFPMMEASLGSYIEKKRREYSSVRREFVTLFDDHSLQLLADSSPLFLPRSTQIGESATRIWEGSHDPDARWTPIEARWSPQAAEVTRRAPRLIRERGEALTWPALAPHLPDEVIWDQNVVRWHLQSNYFSLYWKEYDLVALNHVPHINTTFGVPDGGSFYSFRELLSCLQLLNIQRLLDSAADEFLEVIYSRAWRGFADKLFTYKALDPSLHSARNALSRIEPRALHSDPGHHRASTIISALDHAEELLDTALQKLSPTPDVSPPRIESREVPMRRRIVLATQNEREHKATLEALNSPPADCVVDRIQFVHDDGVIPHWVARMQLTASSTSSIELYVVRADETGGYEAVDLLSRIVRRLTPDDIFFVGCAALLDEKMTADPGTVFLALAAVDADKGALQDGEVAYDLEQHAGDLQIRRSINAMNGAGLFEPIKLVTNRSFISSSKFVNDRTSSARQDLLTKFPRDSVVLEMEAFGIYKALPSLRTQVAKVPPVAVLKGISDFADEDAQADKIQKQTAATMNSAQVVLLYSKALLNESN